MSIWKTQRASLLVILTAILLGGLALLQYRWIGELSEFEYQRMQRTLQASVQAMVRDTERELRRIRFTFAIRSFHDTAAELSAEYREWRNSADFPEIIEAVYWVDSGSGSPTLQRFDDESGLLEPAAWIPHLAPLQEDFEGWSREAERNRLRAPWNRARQLDDGRIAVVVPQNDRNVRAWALVLLDRAALAETFIPAMVERYFGSGEDRDYDVWILEDDEVAPALYASTIDKPAPIMADADVSREIPGFGWTVAARHQTGSLEAFVTQYRWRNLTLGVGTVFVLGISFVFLVVANRRAQLLADRQMEFVAGVSHELRTPIAGISSLSQNLADGVVQSPSRVARYGESINRESRRLTGMVEKVLRFAAVRSGHHRYTFQPLDVRSMVEQELQTFRDYSSGQPQVEQRIPEDLPPVWGDEMALRSVLHNLVSNAVKFDKEGPVVVEAGPAAGGGEIVLSVSDRGEGIPPSELPNIFDPFFRGQSPRDRQVSGSGLGLSIVREIVKAHHGRTEVESKPGDGSVFRVYLPVAGKQMEHGSRV